MCVCVNSHESLFEKARLGIVELEELYITAELATAFAAVQQHKHAQPSEYVQA